MAMKIPDKHYIGMIVSRTGDGNKDDLPLAFMTPEGSDKAALKRKDTVQQWVNRNSRGQKQPAPVVLDNHPLDGFRLLDNVTHSSRYGSTSKWRIEDPRGFELEISSPNLMFLLNETVIDQCDILGTCIWARDGGDNFLLPVSSDIYETALRTSSYEKKSASLRDLKIGNDIVLHNGVAGKYLGKLIILGKSWSNNTVTELERHIIAEPDTDGSCLYGYSSIKLAEIRSKDVLDSYEALSICADLLKKGKSLVSSTYIRAMGAMLKGDTYSTEVIIEDTTWDNDKSFVFKYNNSYYHIDRYSRQATQIRKSEINEHIFMRGGNNYNPYHSYHNYNPTTDETFDVAQIRKEGATKVIRRFETTTSNGHVFHHD